MALVKETSTEDAWKGHLAQRERSREASGRFGEDSQTSGIRAAPHSCFFSVMIQKERNYDGVGICLIGTSNKKVENKIQVYFVLYKKLVWQGIHLAC